MNRMSVPLRGAVLALLLFVGGVARADFIQWTYNWTPSAIALSADSPGSGGITLTNEPLGTAVGTSDIVATNVRTFSSALGDAPGQFDFFTSKAYTLTLNLTDKSVPGHDETATLVFSGEFNGNASLVSSNVANTFTGSTVQTVVLNNNVYTVTIGPYSPPGPPGASNAGSIGAHVDVKGNPPVGGETPEPSSLVLSCLGLSGLGLSRLRKWRSRRAK